MMYNIVLYKEAAFPLKGRLAAAFCDFVLCVLYAKHVFIRLSASYFNKETALNCKLNIDII